jgi:hypothetical protein
MHVSHAYFDSSIIAPQVMISDQWEDMPWRWAALGHGNSVGIQVAEYPTLLLTREPDSWAWRMENEFVYFFEHTLPLDASDDEIYAFAQSRRDPDEAEIIWIDDDDDEEDEDDDDFDGGDDDDDVDEDFDHGDGGDDDDDFDGADAEEDADDFGV